MQDDRGLLPPLQGTLFAATAASVMFLCWQWYVSSMSGSVLGRKQGTPAQSLKTAGGIVILLTMII